MDDGEERPVRGGQRRRCWNQSKDQPQGSERCVREGPHPVRQEEDIRQRPGCQQIEHRPAQPPEHPDTEKQRDGAGDKQWQGQDVESPQPEVLGRMDGKNEKHGQRRDQQRQGDHVIDEAILNIRIVVRHQAFDNSQEQRDEWNEPKVG